MDNLHLLWIRIGVLVYLMFYKYIDVYKFKMRANITALASGILMQLLQRTPGHLSVVIDQFAVSHTDARIDIQYWNHPTAHVFHAL